MKEFDRIRGAADIPLTNAGRQQVSKLGKHFAKNGPLDVVVHADLSRNRETANHIANGAPVIGTPHLRDMDYGDLTGHRSMDAIPTINDHILNNPDKPLPNGESFNSYKDRLTKMLKLGIDAHKQFPGSRIGMVVNRRSIKTAQSWLANGKTDHVYDPHLAVEDDEKLKPADVFHITGSKEGEYGIAKTDASKPMGPGVYLIRHGLTSWNGESYEGQPDAHAHLTGNLKNRHNIG